MRSFGACTGGCARRLEGRATTPTVPNVVVELRDHLEISFVGAAVPDRFLNCAT